VQARYFIGSALLVIALAGCTSTGKSDSLLSSDQVIAMGVEAEKNGYEEQAKALSDGVVSASEYRAAYDLVSACVAGKGYLVSDPVVNPLTSTTYEFTYDSNGRDQDSAIDDYQKCEDRYWGDVALAYGSNAPQSIEPQLKEAIVQCMKVASVNISAADVTTLKDLVGENDGSREQAARDCSLSETQRLYPDMPSVTISY